MKQLKRAAPDRTGNRRARTLNVQVFKNRARVAPLDLDASHPRKGDGGGGSSHDNGNGEGQTGSHTITQDKTQTKSPSLYKVVLLNDDFTPMDFVIHVLQKFFKKEYNEATRIMLQVHQQGAGVAGVFSHEIAETKVFQVNQYSKQNKFPLKCTMEKA